jgi:hypothetical protein
MMSKTKTSENKSYIKHFLKKEKRNSFFLKKKNNLSLETTAQEGASVERVQVLVQDELVACSRTLSGNDGGPSKEDFPNTEPTDTVLFNNLVLVFHPVEVPSVDGGGVVETDGVDGLDFVTGTFDLFGDPVQGSGGISTRENVFGHEHLEWKKIIIYVCNVSYRLSLNRTNESNKERLLLLFTYTPGQVLVLPGTSQTSDLQEEDTVILQQVLDLVQKLLELSDTDVFSHLQTSDLVVLFSGNVSVVHAQDSDTFSDTVLFSLAHTPLGLVATQSDTSNVSTLLGGVDGQGTPTATDVEHLFTLLETDLVGDEVEFVLLELFQGFGVLFVGDDTRGVDHHGAHCFFFLVFFIFLFWMRR